jgi:hypothetical protein
MTDISAAAGLLDPAALRIEENMAKQLAIGAK